MFVMDVVFSVCIVRRGVVGASVSIFRRTLLGYYVEGMHANFK